MRKTALFIMVILIMVFTKSFAQWGLGKPEDIAAIKSRTLIIVVETPDQKIIDKLVKKNKQEYVDVYKKAVDNYNAQMKEAITKFWTFSDKIEYKTDDEVAGLIKAKSKNYTVLRCASTYGNAYSLTTQSSLYWNYKKFTNNQLAGMTSWRNSSILEISLIEKEDTYYPIYFVGMQDIFPVESDIVYGLRTLQSYLIQRENKAGNSQMKDAIKTNAMQLQNKILVIRKDVLDSTLTSADIKSIYPYKFEIDDSAQYEQHIINAEDGYAALEDIPTFSGGISNPTIDYVYTVMDTKSGDCLGYVTPSMASSIGKEADSHSHDEHSPSFSSDNFPNSLANSNSSGKAYNAASLNNSVGSPVANKRVFKKLAEQIDGK